MFGTPPGYAESLPVTTLDSFQNAVAGAPENAQVMLTADGTAVTIRSARLARWIGSHQTATNRQTSNRFIEALRNRYGGEMTGRLTRSSDIYSSALLGRPLHVRQVREILRQGEQMAAAAAAEQRAVPVTGPQAASRSLHRLAPDLAREVRRSLDRGLVNQFALDGDPACPYPMWPPAFTALLRAYNDVMEELRIRFPGLRDIRPPNLSQNRLELLNPDWIGLYQANTSTLSFSNYYETRWHQVEQGLQEESATSPKPTRFTGILLHEYGHHLSSKDISDQSRWLSRLAAMLKKNGFIDDESKIDFTSIEHPSFTLQVGGKARDMGLGSYAGTNAGEFVAEALAWRMTQGYGGSLEIPRMPPYLENWVHECFPFTCDGPIPVSPVEFDSACIREPRLVDGRIRWENRNRPPMPPPRSSSLHPR